jgi:hypothetical protein
MPDIHVTAGGIIARVSISKHGDLGILRPDIGFPHCLVATQDVDQVTLPFGELAGHK